MFGARASKNALWAPSGFIIANTLALAGNSQCNAHSYTTLEISADEETGLRR